VKPAHAFAGDLLRLIVVSRVPAGQASFHSSHRVEEQPEGEP
jgi:hypothetical protein